MTDEKYCFVSDVREKKRIASGAYHKRTHAGKGGAVKMPSDYMTAKERKAMNGEVKSYKLNEPLTWGEFKAMPTDIQICYIKALREKFGVSDTQIGVMMGVSQNAIAKHVKKLGIGLGRDNKPSWKDKEGWYKWVNGVKEEVAEEVDEDCCVEPQEEPCVEQEKTVPNGGVLKFESEASVALDMVKQILSNKTVKLTVIWEVDDGD